jgi:hypothetical protein
MSICPGCAARSADHKVEVKQNIARGEFRLAKPLQHCVDRDSAYRSARLMNRGKGNREQAGVFHVVDSGHPDFCGHTNAQVGKRLEKPSGCEVVRTDDTIRTRAAQHLPDALLIVRLNSEHRGFKSSLSLGDRFTISDNTGIDSGRRSGAANEDYSPASAAKKMRCNGVTGAPVVDSNQIVTAALGIWKQVAVQQNDGDAGLVKNLADRAVDRVLPRSQFERGKKDPGNFSRN